MISDDFKAWRRRLGITQQAAADALGTTRRAIVMWEAGDRPISRTLALACAAVEAGLPPVGHHDLPMPSAHHPPDGASPPAGGGLGSKLSAVPL